MHRGYIKLWRALLDKPIWKQSTPEQKVVLITLIMMANHRQNEWEWMGEKFKVKSGQFVTSLESIRKKAGKGISIKNVRTSLERFKKLKFLANESAKTGRLITIVNWEAYQAERKKTAKKRAKRWQRDGKEVATNNNDKKDNNDKKGKTFCENSIEISLSNLLLDLIIFRNPKHKKPNLQNWALHIDKAIRLDGRTPDELRAAIEWSQSDSFWQSNILSTKKLREKYDQLFLKMKKDGGHRTKGSLVEVNGRVISETHLKNLESFKQAFEEVESGK
jgi:hypothetical protein